MADDDKVRPMTDDEFDFYRKNGRLPTPQETGAQAQKAAAAENAKQAGGGGAGTAGLYERAKKYAGAAAEELGRGAVEAGREAYRKLTGPTPTGGGYLQRITTGEQPLRSMQPGLPSAFQDPQTAAVGQTLSAPFILGEAAAQYGIPRVAASLGTQYLGGRGARYLAEKGGLGERGQAGAEFLGQTVGGVLPFVRLGPAATPRKAAPTGYEDLKPLPTPEPAAKPAPTPRPKSRGPTATETLDAATEKMFPGKKFGDLDHDDQMKVMRGGAGGGPAEPTTVPRGTPPAPVPGAPGGIERREPGPTAYTGPERRVLPGVYQRSGYAQPTAGEQLAADVARARAGTPAGIEEGEAMNLIQRDPTQWEQFKAAAPKQQDAMLVAARNALLEQRKPQPSTLPPTPAATPTPGAAPAAPGAPGATLPTVRPLPRSVTVGPSTSTLPPAPEATTLPPTSAVPKTAQAGTIPPISLEEALRRATGQPEPPKLEPGVPLKEQLGKG